MNVINFFINFGSADTFLFSDGTIIYNFYCIIGGGGIFLLYNNQSIYNNNSQIFFVNNNDT